MRLIKHSNVSALSRLTSLLSVSFLLCLSQTGLAEEEVMEEQVVVGDLNSLPGENVDSIFGFGKSILETPRSASTISEEMMDRFNMQDIDELILVSPLSLIHI